MFRPVNESLCFLVSNEDDSMKSRAVRPLAVGLLWRSGDRKGHKIALMFTCILDMLAIRFIIIGNRNNWRQADENASNLDHATY